MRIRALVGVGAAALLLAACSSGGSSSSSTAATAHGTVSVLYAGSLVNLMEHEIGPAFSAKTGYGYSGYGAGSKQIATEIENKVRQGDVFISASPDADKTLMGSANGSWVTWYAEFATAPLVIAYYPGSSFAHQLRTKPWYEVITEPGFRIGRTDPVLDPKGKLTATALGTAAVRYHRPELLALLHSTSNVFPEETLAGRLAAGQLDAGFFYTSEAAPLHLPTISLAPLKFAAKYTVTVLSGAPNDAGGVAFTQYLLGPPGLATMKANGLFLVQPPKVSGTVSSVPPELMGVLRTG